MSDDPAEASKLSSAQAMTGLPGNGHAMRPQQDHATRAPAATLGGQPTATDPAGRGIAASAKRV